MEPRIRLIRPEDNTRLKSLIPEILETFGAVGEGYACADPELNDMYEAYREDRSAYWVIEWEGEVWGGGGIAPLKNSDPLHCELQKMYFHPDLRGRGLGKKVIDLSLEFARDKGFEFCYLETLPNMQVAQKLYQSFGFKFISERMGGTGHSKCPTFMLLELN